MGKKDDSRAECGVPSAALKTQEEKRAGSNWSFNPHSAFRTLHSKGFTLLEVMVAVAVLATVLVTLLGLKNRGVQDVVLAEHLTTATLLAKRLMTEALVIGPAVPLEDEGTFEEEQYKDYTWRKSVTMIPVTDTDAVKEIRVAVLWKEGEREETVELVSYE